MQVAIKRRIQTDWAFATLEELKARRIEAMQRAVQAEGDAVEPRRQAEMYMKAASNLAARSVALEAYAKAHAANGDPGGAAQKRAKAAELQRLSTQNWLLADQKARLAMKYEGRAHQETVLARRLTMEIRSRTGSFDDPGELAPIPA